jgi:hypothetical protein
LLNTNTVAKIKKTCNLNKAQKNRDGLLLDFWSSFTLQACAARHLMHFLFFIDRYKKASITISAKAPLFYFSFPLFPYLSTFFSFYNKLVIVIKV